MGRIADFDILIVPGLGNSDEEHWQSRWENRIPTARRVLQNEWHSPKLDEWVARLRAEIKAAEKPIILVAHSLGVHAVVHAVQGQWDFNVKGAFLVAPPSEQAIESDPVFDRAFLPVPREPLPFPSVVVASRNDPYSTYDDSADLALAWGSRVVDAGESGHINGAAGFGPWPEGMMSFAGFLSKIS